MSLLSKLGLVTSCAILSLGLSSKGNEILYDDFDSGLNTSKWIELPGSNLNNTHLDQHLVLFNEGNGFYHASSNEASDKGTALQIKNRKFKAGDSVRYEVDYISGSGNRISTINIDGVGHYTSLFGFWNSLSDGGVGNDFGKYQIKLNFLEDGIYPEVTVPNGEIKTTVSLIPYPVLDISEHSFGFVTRTGHNGTVEMNYDNVYVNKIDDSSTTLSLLGLSCLVLGASRLRNKLN